MRIFLIAIFSLYICQLPSFEIYIPPIPIPEDIRSELSIVMDSEKNMVATWLENGIVYVSELPREGAWTIPAPLSSVLKKASSPRMAIDASGMPTVMWLEENSIKTATRPDKEMWKISTMEPALLESYSTEGKSRLSVSLFPLAEEEEEEMAFATIQVGAEKAGAEKQDMDLQGDELDPALLPMANAIDAPTSSVLSGGQIGFAAGTAAPANGFIVSGQVGVGTSSPNSSSKLHVYSGNTVLQTPTLYGPAQFVYDTLDVWPTLYTNSTNGGISVNTIDTGGYAPVTSRFALKSNSGGSYRGAIDIITRNSSNVVLTNVEAISILESGNVGINESNPLTPLQISKSASGSTTYDIVTLFNSAAVDAAGFRIRSAPYTGNTQSYIDFVGNSLSNFQSYLTFGVNNGGGAFEAMRIDRVGNVGIGTTSPISRLHVHTTGTTTPTTELITNLYSGQNTSGGDYTIGQLFLGTNSGPYYSGMQVRIPNNAFGDSCRLDFTTPASNNDNTQVTRMSIMPFTGRVGIGITSPSVPLDVVGTTQVRGATGTNPATLILNPAGAGFVSQIQSLAASPQTLNITHNGNLGIAIGSAGNVGIASSPIGGSSLTVYKDVINEEAISVTNSALNKFIRQRPVLSLDAYNNITEAGDVGIFFDNGAATATFGLVLAPWAANSSGIRITSSSTAVYPSLGINRPPSGSGHTLEVYRNDGNFNYVNIENGQNAQSAVRLKTPSAEWINYIPTSSTELRFYNSSDLLTITAAGHLLPGIMKLQDIGSTANRWGTIYYFSASTGNARLAAAKTICPDCNQTMKRGTGTTYTIGEDGDYIPVFCTECGHQKMERIQHLPRARLLQRRPPPKIEFLGLKVNQYSGNSRGIQVLYRYIDKTEEHSAVENSTCLSDSEYEQFLLLSESEQRAYLKELGQREWDAIEEVRLMKEECASLQTQLDAIVGKWVGTDLSLSP